jgi:hypothetical protein
MYGAARAAPPAAAPARGAVPPHPTGRRRPAPRRAAPAPRRRASAAAAVQQHCGGDVMDVLPAPALAAILDSLQPRSLAALRVASRAGRAAVDALLPRVAVLLSPAGFAHDAALGVRPEAAVALAARFPAATRLVMRMAQGDEDSDAVALAETMDAEVEAAHAFAALLSAAPPGAWRQLASVHFEQGALPWCAPELLLAALARAAPALAEITDACSEDVGALPALALLAGTLTRLKLEQMGELASIEARALREARAARGVVAAAIGSFAHLRSLEISFGNEERMFACRAAQEALPRLPALEELGLGWYPSYMAGFAEPLAACSALRALALQLRANDDGVQADLEAMAARGLVLPGVTSLRLHGDCEP